MFLGKSTKTDATRAAFFDSNMHQIVCRLGLRPEPQTPLGELTTLPRHPAAFRGLLLKARERRGGRVFVLCPRKKKEKSAPMHPTEYDRV